MLLRDRAWAKPAFDSEFRKRSFPPELESDWDRVWRKCDLRLVSSNLSEQADRIFGSGSKVVNHTAGLPRL
jgi:hypothetical protein